MITLLARITFGPLSGRVIVPTSAKALTAPMQHDIAQRRET